MQFIQENWAAIAGIAALIILLGERIARLTPTETDNRLFAALRRFATVVGVVVPDNPGKGKDPKP